MKLCVLGSGSRGNAVYVESGRTRLLIDAGFSARQLKKRLSAIGVDPGGISAVIVSHEHADHIAGLRVLGRELSVYATRGTLGCIRSRFQVDSPVVMAPGQWCVLNGMRVLPVPVSHDAIEPVGFIIEDPSGRAGVFTDQGVVTRLMLHHMSDLDVAVVEANHDPAMLVNGPYTWELKQRIKSRHGHLSNHEAAELVSALMGKQLRHVMLAHLSETNNQPGLAVDAVLNVTDGSGVQVQACCQGRPGEVIVIE